VQTEGALVPMHNERVRGPAMTDVAKLAGVSHQTVSRVINDQPNVSAQTRTRVLAAIAELGFRPNRAARSLVTGRTDVLGVVAQASTLFGPAGVLAALDHAAAEAGLTVSVANLRALDRASISEAVNRHLEHHVIGIVIIAPVATATEAVAGLHPRLPVVMVDGDPRADMPLVTIDQHEGARLATQHLLDAGHTTVWHVSGPTEWFDAAGRIEGWRSTLEAAGAEAPPTIAADWSASSGYQAGLMLARMSDVTAVFAANDHQALGIMRALAERGRRVPADVSIVGFDDVPEAAYFLPPLTTVRADFDEVARRTLAMLLGQISAGESDGLVQRIPPVLVSRASVGPPPVH